MKTVIVFDTDDHEGMENTLKIVDHLAKQYLKRGAHTRNERSFGRIKFIKAVRAYDESCQKKRREDPDFKSGLKSAKQFADHYWSENAIK